MTYHTMGDEGLVVCPKCGMTQRMHCPSLREQLRMAREALSELLDELKVARRVVTAGNAWAVTKLNDRKRMARTSDALVWALADYANLTRR